MCRPRRFVVLAAMLALLGALASTLTDASGASRPIRPVLGDWEGSGPLGLRLSFAFVRSRGGQVVVRNLALGLPTSCGSAGAMTWDAGLEPKVEYIAPGTVLHGPFPPLGPRQFELLLPPTPKQPLPAPFEGTFSSSRRGTVSVQSWTRYSCRHTRWPRTLRFALHAAHRVAVADGLWTGGVTSPAGVSGTVKIHVIGRGRLETEFAATYACPGGDGGSFEIGPLPTVGFLIAADGSIVPARGTQSVWGGRFGSDGVMRGTFTASFCSPALKVGFTARRTG